MAVSLPLESTPLQKNERRKNREAAVRELNELAAANGLEDSQIATRAGEQTASALYKLLTKKLPGEKLVELRAVRQKWVDNGGGSMPEEWLPALQSPAPMPEAQADAIQEAEAETAEALPDEPAETSGEHIHSHGPPPTDQDAKFRLRARAFLLTFNSLLFAAVPDIWQLFLNWVQERCKSFAATYWSATMEESLNSEDKGRVHFHCYFSWHDSSSSGIDHTTTDAWMFRGVRPRVDINREHRGPSHWRKATQHGHFYVQVCKKGTLNAATNYAAWGGDWVPDAWWVVTLWRPWWVSLLPFVRGNRNQHGGREKNM